MGGCCYFPLIAPLNLDLYLIMLRIKQGVIKYNFFESLGRLDVGLNPGFPDHWQTRTIMPMSRSVYTKAPGNRDSIPARVIPKTQKMVLIPTFLTLSIIMYVLRVKWSNHGKRVAPSATPRCSSY